jgi:uncharacterized protein YodC (DUF2158 family)
MTLEIGDIIRLKSGGPLMTVMTIEFESATATWFVGEDVKQASFSQGSIEIHSRPSDEVIDVQAPSETNACLAFGVQPGHGPQPRYGGPLSNNPER